MSNRSEQVIYQEKMTCNSCSKKLECFDLKTGAKVIIGKSKKLYSGVICKECFKVECTACKGLPLNAPCKWCEGEVISAYDDFFLKEFEFWQKDRLFITITDTCLYGVGYGDLFLTSWGIIFIHYNSSEKEKRGTCRKCEWGMELTDRENRNKGSIILLPQQIISSNVNENEFFLHVIENPNINAQSQKKVILRFIDINESALKLLEGYSKGEKAFNTLDYERLGFNNDFIPPLTFIDLILKENLDEFTSDELKAMSQNSVYMKKLWEILDSRPELTYKQRVKFAIALAKADPSSFKFESEKYAKNNIWFRALTFGVICGGLAMLILVYVTNKGFGGLLHVLGYILCIFSAFFFIATIKEFTKGFRIISQLKKIG